MMQQDTHIFQGMKRDNHPINQDKQFLWGARNIRLTTRDNNTLLSITNEKSTTMKLTFNEEENSKEAYIGHCVIGDYLVVFTTIYKPNSNGDSPYYVKDSDCIYRVDLRQIKKIILYRGDLNLQFTHPMQTIGSYESSNIQKVYWTDSINPPRVINIMKPELNKWEADNPEDDVADYTKSYSKEAPFDFVQNLKLEEKVSVERLSNGNGIFPPGVIQYAFTYYHKYGQESNIFHVTEPLYISFSDRGGSPEDNISTAFEITVENVQDTFSHLRVYSILRTSIDATPTVKRVTDIDLKETIGEGSNKIIYVDNGTTGDTVDPSMLLYIGGKDITAGCIASKDNTLFLGDIAYNRKDISTLGISDAIKGLNVVCRTRTVDLNNSQNSTNNIYKYQNQLSKNTSTFKVGETYRLGLQFQYKNGEWSEPVFIRDIKMEGVRPKSTDTELKLPVFKVLDGSIVANPLENAGYRKVRPLVVLPSTKDRTILAQGMVCPTVFNFGHRMSNAPFSQSSWLLRPFCTDYPPTANDSNFAKAGSIAEFRHLAPLLSGFNRGAEVQNMFLDEEAYSNQSDNHDYSLNKINTDDSSYNAIYYVDQSILTFHSPDIEFDDATQRSIDGNSIKIKLVGAIPFSSNCGDIDVQLSTVNIDPDASGFIHRSIINPNAGGRSLISGLFFEDSFVNDTKNAEEFVKAEAPVPWMTHMWHRSGSLNNDCVRPEGKGSQTAVLKKKIISNIKFADDVKWLKPEYAVPLGTSELQLFNSNEVSLLKIKDSNSGVGDITYYGNVDSMNPSYSKFRLITGLPRTLTLTSTSGTFSGYISIDTSDGYVTKHFTNLKVGNITGSPYTRRLAGTVTSDTIVKVPVQREDEATGDIITVEEDLSLKGGYFNISLYDFEYTGTITIASDVYTVRGQTSFNLDYDSSSNEGTVFNFASDLRSVDPSNDHIGDYHAALKLPKDAVRIKYKSTPHVVFATNYNETYGTRDPIPVIDGTPTGGMNFGSGFSKLPWSVDNNTGISKRVEPLIKFEDLSHCPTSYLWLAEIVQDVDESKRFGGKTSEALQNNLWIPAGPAVSIGSPIEWQWGDTWFQRYDCLKTYPFTNEDINQVVEIGSFMCETRVNIDGRYDRNRGAISNLNVSPVNFNKINPVYSQKNNFFNYRILDSDYYNISQYPSQILWTGVKSPSSVQDAWTNLHMANSIDLDGSLGRVISIQPFNDLLIGFQERAVEQILFNNRVQIQASDGVPIEIANSQKVEGTRTISNTIGCQSKFNVISTPKGIYFIDKDSYSIYLFDGNLTNLSLQLGSTYWVRKAYNNAVFDWMFPPQYTDVDLGVRLFYDENNQDVYFSPGYDSAGLGPDALCFSEKLNQFTSLMSYGGAVMFSYDSRFYSIAFDMPKYKGKLRLWENFAKMQGTYNNIFGREEDYWISFISNDNPTITKVFDTIEMSADCYIPESNRTSNYGLLGSDLTHTNQTGRPFNYISVENEYQYTNRVELNSTNMRKKFRLWRAVIPRNHNSRERIRNPWTKITLGMKNPGSQMTILHNLSVNYTV